MNTFLVTATPPTTNGDLHVGHLAGPYLAADVFVRYQRMRQREAIYLCSGDDHQSYVVTTALRRGRDPEELVRLYTGVIQSTLRAAHIEVDAFTSALGNARHADVVQGFFGELYRQGMFVEKDSRIFRCLNCRRHLFESYVKGLCPHCGEPAAGNLCEACGRVNDPTTLRNPACSVCGEAPTLEGYRGLFLPLERFRPALRDVYASRSWRPHLRELCAWLTRHPLPDYPVTYPTDWGLAVPVDGFVSQRINVWVEMYPGHIATTRAWAEGEGTPALADLLWGGEATLVQFLGYDNSFFNAVLHIALALADRHHRTLPDHLVTNEFYLLDGEKFSTSRNHAIWGSEILTRVPADALRYHLSRTNPEHMQTNFSEDEFSRVVAEELIGRWGGVINTFLGRAGTRNGGKLGGSALDVDLQARGLLGWAKARLERCYDGGAFSLRDASGTLAAYVDGCAAYLHGAVLPLASQGGRRYTQRLASLGWLLRGLSYLAAPLMPAFAQQLWSTLGGEAPIGRQDWSQMDSVPLALHRLGSPREWFVPPEPSPGHAARDLTTSSPARRMQGVAP